MKRHIMVAVCAVLFLGLFFSYPILDSRVLAEGGPGGEKITVLTPMGTPPPVKLKPMAPRLDTLNGKTIYLVDQGYLGSDNLLKEMAVWLEKEYPTTNFVFKRLGREMGPEPPALFAEIKEKADAVIMGVGH